MSSIFLLIFSLVRIAFLSDFWLGILNLKNKKLLKKELNEEMMPVAWHPNRWWNGCASEDEKREIDPMLIEELEKCVSIIYNMGILGHFYT